MKLHLFILFGKVSWCIEKNCQLVFTHVDLFSKLVFFYKESTTLAERNVCAFSPIVKNSFRIGYYN